MCVYCTLSRPVSQLLRCFFFLQAEDGIRAYKVTGVQTCALPISSDRGRAPGFSGDLRWALSGAFHPADQPTGFQRHLPERDGLLNALLLANVMAEENRTLGQLVADLQAEYGEHQYGRIDLHIADELKNSAIARAKALA